ncbi:sporulation protein YqfD [Dorea sp. D27]|uniref:sporulation protein YqfD n=1 Tax=Dorea sp. D27 TaxID=658665 RepID=UPI000B0B2D94|nr:sporulation protein YqfD [Dorea sp. D27]
MLLSMIRYIKGYVQIRVIGYSAERFLNACSHRGIYIWGLRPSNGAYEMYMSVDGFRKLKPIIKKTGTRVVVAGRFGLPFFLHRYRKRKLFFIGAFLSVALIYILSLFIWDIDIEGNLSQTDENILEFLQTKEVEHGMKKSSVDCARIVKDIRKEYDGIIWVSASIQGSRLIIQVKENEDSLPAAGGGEELKEEDTGSADGKEEEEPQDIVADIDCTITEIITRKGTPEVKEGDAVKKGDLLVCGRVPVNNDAGETTGYHYHKSDADIKGKAVIPYEQEQDITYIEKELPEVKRQELYIKIGRYRFGLGSRKHGYEHYEVLSQEKRWKIGEEFYLPVSTGTRTIQPYRTEKHKYSDKQLQAMLSARFDKYCEDLEKKGVEIIENDVKIYTGSEKAIAKGNLTVIMPIGATAPTEVVDVPEQEEDGTSGDNIDGNDGDSH